MTKESKKKNMSIPIGQYLLGATLQNKLVV
jgi:hypothetical protein